MNSLIGNKIKRIFAVGLLLLLSFSAVSQSLVGSWYEDSLHERSRFRNYFYRLNDTQLSVIDKKHNNAEVFFDYKIRDDYIIITSTGQSSPKISAGTFPITIKNENYFTIHFSTPLSFVRNSYAKEQAVDATKKAAIVAAAGYGAAIVGAVGGKAIAPVALASSANAATGKKVAAEKAVVGAGSDSPTTATADKKVASGTRLSPTSKVATAVTHRLPVSNGTWENLKQPGNSIWIPQGEFVPKKFNTSNLTWSQILQNYNLKGIKFKDAYPDFTPIAVTSVKIDGFSDNRDANFAKAYEQLVKKIGEKQASNLISSKQYTWHEVEDMCTMQLVPRIIHGNIEHEGGIATIRNKLRQR